MGKKLFVGNLPFAATDTSLAELFAQCGTVESSKIITDRETGRSKGFGFVEMSSDSEALEAISKLNGIDNGGRPMSVSEAKPQAPRDSRGGGGGGRGFGGGGGGGRGFGGGRDRDGGGRGGW
ncbi:MAG TPA: RNA-binding protein [Bdellovibrionota bacterium]|jgi:RNA recognition motif-containing protein|nr:RNA-binding protein [Bdellovibrionota bacterium]